MTAEEKIRVWVNDSGNHVIIWAKDWSDATSRGVKRDCDACGHPVSVWPAVAKKMAENPNFHVLCQDRCLPLTLEINGPVPYGGRI